MSPPSCYHQTLIKGLNNKNNIFPYFFTSICKNSKFETGLMQSFEQLQANCINYVTWLALSSLFVFFFVGKIMVVKLLADVISKVWNNTIYVFKKISFFSLRFRKALLAPKTRKNIFMLFHIIFDRLLDVNWRFFIRYSKTSLLSHFFTFILVF